MHDVYVKWESKTLPLYPRSRVSGNSSRNFCRTIISAAAWSTWQAYLICHFTVSLQFFYSFYKFYQRQFHYSSSYDSRIWSEVGVTAPNDEIQSSFSYLRILVKSGEFVNLSQLTYFSLNLDYIAARSLRQPCSHNTGAPLLGLAKYIYYFHYETILD